MHDEHSSGAQDQQLEPFGSYCFHRMRPALHELSSTAMSPYDIEAPMLGWPGKASDANIHTKHTLKTHQGPRWVCSCSCASRRACGCPWSAGNHGGACVRYAFLSRPTKPRKAYAVRSAQCYMLWRQPMLASHVSGRLDSGQRVRTMVQ